MGLEKETEDARLIRSWLLSSDSTAPSVLSSHRLLARHRRPGQLLGRPDITGSVLATKVRLQIHSSNNIPRVETDAWASVRGRRERLGQ